MLIMIGLNVKFFFVIAIIAGAIAAVVVAGPLHASCTINCWNFDESCSTVEKAIVDQIKKWNGPSGCDNGGEKCLYELKSQSDSKIEATHTTPKKHYVDDLTFDFTSGSGSCAVKGHSTSETWYAVLDYGTNYCNLRNLITGSGLDKAKGFSEETNDDKCTQYSSHNCTVY